MLVSQALMSAPEISLILATGGPQMVGGQEAGTLLGRAAGDDAWMQSGGSACSQAGPLQRTLGGTLPLSCCAATAGARRLLVRQPRPGRGRGQHAGGD